MALSETNPVRIMLIDDHPIVRTGICMLVESHPQLQVVGQASHRAEAIAIATSEQPDIIVLDLDLGAEQGLALLPDLLVAAPHTRILILTGVKDLEVNLQAVQLGAMGVVTKDQAGENLIQAIHKINAGEAWLDGMTAAKVLTHFNRAPGNSSFPDPEAEKIASLTPREQQIIKLVCEGLKNQLIADQLMISEGTVRNHLTVIYSKLVVKDRFGLIVYAGRHGLN